MASSTESVPGESRPTARLQGDRIEIVGDVSRLDAAEALLLARALLAAALAVTDVDLEELRGQLQLHHRSLTTLGGAPQ